MSRFTTEANTRASIIAIACSLLLASCTAHKQAASVASDPLQRQIDEHKIAHQLKLKNAKKVSSDLQKLSQTIALNRKSAKETQTLIPKLVAESDTALQKAKHDKSVASAKSKIAAKQPAKGSEAQPKAASSVGAQQNPKKEVAQQDLADKKAAELMAARQRIDTLHDQKVKLELQVKELTAQKQKTERLAQAEAQQLKKLEDRKLAQQRHDRTHM